MIIPAGIIRGNTVFKKNFVSFLLHEQNPKGTQRDPKGHKGTQLRKKKRLKKSHISRTGGPILTFTMSKFTTFITTKNISGKVLLKNLSLHIPFFRKQKKLTYQGFVEMQALKIFFDWFSKFELKHIKIPSILYCKLGLLKLFDDTL